MPALVSKFQHIPLAPPDSILNLNKLFREATNPKKVSLGVGAYRDGEGKPWILPSVKKAEEIISSDLEKYNKEYPPQPGFPEFLKAAQEFLLGEGHPALKSGRCSSCQSLSGTGSLHVGFCLLDKYFPDSQVYMPNVTWPNHYSIYSKVAPGKMYKEYTYLYKNGKLAIDFENTVKDLNNAPNQSVFLFHACAHNPSGIDFSKEQWKKVMEICKAKSHIPFFDIAYEGFATGSFEDDGFAPRMFAKEGIEFLVAQSFSKNFGLYGERVGACHVIHNGDAAESTAIESEMQLIVRATWSMSPIHGAYIVQTIGGNPELKKQFLEDVETMASRIKDMREKLYDALKKNKCPGDWEHIKTCIGMFTYTGLNKDQVMYMRDKYAVFLVTQGGRMSMCGLTTKNVEYVAEAMKGAVVNCK